MWWMDGWDGMGGWIEMMLMYGGKNEEWNGHQQSHQVLVE